MVHCLWLEINLSTWGFKTLQLKSHACSDKSDINIMNNLAKNKQNNDKSLRQYRCTHNNASS